MTDIISKEKIFEDFKDSLHRICKKNYNKKFPRENIITFNKFFSDSAKLYLEQIKEEETLKKIFTNYLSYIDEIFFGLLLPSFYTLEDTYPEIYSRLIKGRSREKIFNFFCYFGYFCYSNANRLVRISIKHTKNDYAFWNEFLHFIEKTELEMQRDTFEKISKNTIVSHLWEELEKGDGYLKKGGRREYEKEKSSKKRVLEKFPSPSDLKWNEVTIKFVSKDSLKISARGIIKTYMFSNIGLIDKRKGDLPNVLWDILKDGFAAHGGNIYWDTAIDPRWKKNFTKSVSRIRKILKTIMGLEDDPFYPYLRIEGGEYVKSYKTKFKIKDNSY